MTLERLISVIRPQFFIERNSVKPYQTNEIMEGSKSAAIVMIVGISNVYNIDKKEVMKELGIDYDEYRHKLSVFQLQCEEVNKVDDPSNLTGALRRFYWKLRLVQNALTLMKNNQVININEILSI